MAYLGKIKKVEKSVRAVVTYLEKDSRSEASIARIGINVPSDPSLFMTAHRGLMAHHQVPADRIEGRTIVISFTREELDPDNPEDCEKGRRIVERTFQRAWGDRGFGVLGHMQRDGKKGFLHGHGLAPNVHQETGKAMRGDDYSWERIALILNEEMEREGVQHSHEAMRERVRKIEEHEPHRYERSAHVTADVQARMRGDVPLPDRVAAAMKQLQDAPGPKPTSMEELDEALAPSGLSVRRRGKRAVYSEREGKDGKRPQSAREDRVQLAAQQLYPDTEHHRRAVMNMPERTYTKRHAPRVTLEELEDSFTKAQQVRQASAQRQQARALEEQRKREQIAREIEARRQLERSMRPSSYRPPSAHPSKDTGPELG